MWPPDWWTRKASCWGRPAYQPPRGREQWPTPSAQKVAENAGIAMTEVESVGLAVPGTFDPKMGLVYRAVNLGLENVPLGSMVGQRLDLPVVLENDANAAALGEFVAGAGRGHSSLVAVTLGTGVGAGAILDGKLYVGFNYAALEAGHMVIRRGGRQCNCGRKGCWEAYASATGLIASTKEAMARHPESALWEMAPSFDKVTGKTPFDAAQAGDRVAKNVVDDQHPPARDHHGERRRFQAGGGPAGPCSGHPGPGGNDPLHRQPHPDPGGSAGQRGGHHRRGVGAVI